LILAQAIVRCSNVGSQNIILSQKPAITTTVTSLPPVLLEQLLSELSTLASVYHKPPESFVGKGRFGADEIQRAAIQEQRQNLADEPIAASVAAAAAAAANGGGSSGQNTIENLLDIDFDGAAPASSEHGGGGVATPDRMASPAAVGGLPGAPPQPSSSIADMMGLFDAPAPAPAAAPVAQPSAGWAPPGGSSDLMSSFAGMDLSGTSAPPPPGQQLGHIKPVQPGQAQGGGGGSEDLLGLF